MCRTEPGTGQSQMGSAGVTPQPVRGLGAHCPRVPRVPRGCLSPSRTGPCRKKPGRKASGSSPAEPQHCPPLAPRSSGPRTPPGRTACQAISSLCIRQAFDPRALPGFPDATPGARWAPLPSVPLHPYRGTSGSVTALFPRATASSESQVGPQRPAADSPASLSNK